MNRVKKITAVCMGAVLAGLCVVALLSDLSISIKCFAIFSAVYGFFELYGWFKNK